MQNIKINDIDAQFDAMSDLITFKFENLEVNVGFCAESFNSDLMITDGTEDDEVYPLTLHNSAVKMSDLEDNWPVAVIPGKSEELLACINKALNILTPHCSPDEAYRGH